VFNIPITKQRTGSTPQNRRLDREKKGSHHCSFVIGSASRKEIATTMKKEEIEERGGNRELTFKKGGKRTPPTKRECPPAKKEKTANPVHWGTVLKRRKRKKGKSDRPSFRKEKQEKASASTRGARRKEKGGRSPERA